MADSTNNYLFRLYFGENIKTMDKDVPTLVLEQRRKKEGYKVDNDYYDLVLNGVKFSRKIYEPGLIEAEVTIDRIFFGLDGSPIPPSAEKISSLFLMRRVELGIVNKDKLKDNPDAADERIARNYYVYKLNPQITRGTNSNLMNVKLTIHSMDKLMTLDKYSKCYTAKKLGAEILEYETQSFGFQTRLLHATYENLQHLKYSFTDSDSKTSLKEFIHPYLVQYNESFYDFMVRTANRCGEFFFFENGELNLGVALNTTKPTVIKDFDNVTFQDYSATPISVTQFTRDSVKKGYGSVDVMNFENIPKDESGFPLEIFPTDPVYNSEIATDEYIYPIVGDKWCTFPYEMGFDPKYGSGQSFADFGIALVLSLISNELKNTQTDGICNAIDFAINCAKEWGVLAAKCFFFINMSKLSFGLLSSLEIDAPKNEKYMSNLLEKPEQADKKNNKVVAFSTLSTDGWPNLDFYKKIHSRQIEQQQKMICIDMGTNYASVKLGDTIKVDGLDDHYVVTEIRMLSDQQWTHNYKKFDDDDPATDIFSGKQSQVIFAIPTYSYELFFTTIFGNLFPNIFDKEYIVPYLIKAPLYRKSGPQTAFVVDSDDPKYQGRVRIVYPWQSTTQQTRIALGESVKEMDYEEEQINKINALLAELEATRTRMNKMENLIKETAGKSEKERERFIKELEISLKSDKQRIDELDIPGNTYDFDISQDPNKLAEVINNYAKGKNLTQEQYNELIANQAEVGRLKEEIKVLEAILAALEGKTQVDFDKLLADLNKEIEENETSLEKLKAELEKRKTKRDEKQKAVKEATENWSGDLSVLASPWVRIATPMATTGGGSFYKPQVGDEVLVNYDNDNIERPYVVGSLYSKNVQTPQFRNNIVGVRNPLLSEASTYIVSPNGHHIVFNDPEDGSKLMSGIQGGLTALAGAAGLTFKFLKDMAGGIHIGDRYGLYEISMSAHERKVDIRSPYGDVNIDAFTGITLNAPNGDIKISGKNVSIEAGNNITIKSGLNIQKPVLGHPTGAGKFGNFVAGVAFGILGGIADTIAGMFFDMYFIRCFMEVMLRPIEGTMEIKSNRYMKLEAGIDSFAQIPANRYTGSKDRNRVAKEEIVFLSKIVNCIDKIDTVYKDYVANYITLWNTAVTNKSAVELLGMAFIKDDLDWDNFDIQIVKTIWRDVRVDREYNDLFTQEYFEDTLETADQIGPDGQHYTLAQKTDKMVEVCNNLSRSVYDFHKHISNFDTLFDVIPDLVADDKMKEMVKESFDSRKEQRMNAWRDKYLDDNEPKSILFESKIDEDSTTDEIIATSIKFRRALAAVFIAKVAECDEYQLDDSLGEGAGNLVANFLRNPLDAKAKGKFLHVHFTPEEVKEDEIVSEYHWQHFVDRMRKPMNLVLRKLYDSLVEPFKAHLQIDEFAKIHDREVWADRGYGNILMSDTKGECKVFDNGRFVAEIEAVNGNWEALIRRMKGIK